jgi:hypothetical protein
LVSEQIEVAFEADAKEKIGMSVVWLKDSSETLMVS